MLTLKKPSLSVFLKKKRRMHMKAYYETILLFCKTAKNRMIFSLISAIL